VGTNKAPRTNTPAPNKCRRQRAQAKHDPAGRRQVLWRQNTQLTILWANDKYRRAATPDDNREEPPAMEDDNNDDNVNDDRKQRSKKAAPSPKVPEVTVECDCASRG